MDFKHLRLVPLHLDKCFRKLANSSGNVRQLVTMINRPSTSQVNWTIKPNPALIDEKVRIALDGLEPKKNVTVSIKFQTDKKTWLSHAHYETDNTGHLDLSKASSLGGRYTGVAPCGLFWSAYIPGDPISRFHLRNLNVPHEANLYVSDGHLDENQLAHATPISKTVALRQFKSDGVTRIPIREGRLRGTLFIPEGAAKQKFPGVIDLYGTTGGLLETRAALLASRGFATLALAYFGYEDLPKAFETIELEYFKEAVHWLCSHEKVISEGIGMIGMSKGAEIALFTSAVSEKVKAVVAINSFWYNSTIQHSFNGLKFPCTLPDLEYIRTVDDNRALDLCYENVPDEEKFCIPVEASNSAEFLFIHGSEDCLVSSSNGVRLAQRLLDHDKKNFSLHIYHGAGHIINPPQTPLCSATFHKMFDSKLYFGGQNPEHAHAQEDAWSKTLDFFSRRLIPKSKI